MTESPAPPSSNGGAAPPALRIVPGAPPPPPVTKSQIKKRKKAAVARVKEEIGAGLDVVASPRDAALVDHIPSAISETLVADSEEIKDNLEPETPGTALSEKPASPIIDQIVNKKLKHFSKKLVSRIKHFRYLTQILITYSLSSNAFKCTHPNPKLSSMTTRKKAFRLSLNSKQSRRSSKKSRSSSR